MRYNELAQLLKKTQVQIVNEITHACQRLLAATKR